MNKIKLALLVSGVLFTSANAFAVDKGTVEFTGALTSDTCKIIDADINKKVKLPTLSTQVIKANGDEGGWTRFEIHVEDCAPGVTKVAAHFEGNGFGTVDPTTGFLKNLEAGGADNVQIAIRNKDGAGAGDEKIKIGGTGEYFDVTKGNGADANKAMLVYEGGYYAVGTTTAGPVKAKTIYTLAYQ
ncbi:MAG TPA: F17 fimbrial protein [Morganella sp. (in: Bacteria)]|nr:F17 fimbrial protein [Morganella sp. (in: enterobacteria)]